MKTILRTVLLFGFVFGGWMATSAMIEHEQSVSIMFNPDTDGPIRIEEKPRASIVGGTGGVCMTTMAFAAGSQAMPVYTPCTGASGGTGIILGGGGGGGAYPPRIIRY